MNDHGDREDRFHSAFVGGLRENETLLFTQRLTLIHCQLFLGNSNWLSKLKADSVTEISPNVYEIEWSDSYPDGESSKWTITFDGSNGYSPVKQVMSERYSDADAWRITESSEATWINKSGAWVPVKFTCRDHEVDETLEFKLDWQSVNEAIPESLFGYEEFDPAPPAIVNVVDYSLGTRIELKPRGVPFKQKNIKQRSSKNSYRLLLISLGVILALFVWRASKRKSSNC